MKIWNKKGEGEGTSSMPAAANNIYLIIGLIILLIIVGLFIRAILKKSMAGW